MNLQPSFLAISLDLNADIYIRVIIALELESLLQRAKSTVKKVFIIADNQPIININSHNNIR